MKVGSLDFAISSPSPLGWWAEPLVVTKKTEDVSISLLPTLGSQFSLCLCLSALCYIELECEGERACNPGTGGIVEISTLKV